MVVYLFSFEVAAYLNPATFRISRVCQSSDDLAVWFGWFPPLFQCLSPSPLCGSLALAPSSACAVLFPVYERRECWLWTPRAYSCVERWCVYVWCCVWGEDKFRKHSVSLPPHTPPPLPLKSSYPLPRVYLCLCVCVSTSVRYPSTRCVVSLAALRSLPSRLDVRGCFLDVRSSVDVFADRMLQLLLRCVVSVLEFVDS